MRLLDTTATVEAPERIRFRYRIAGPGPRAVAWAIDLVVRAGVALGLFVVIGLLLAVPGLHGIGMGLMLLSLFLLEWFYGVVFETLLAGRTPGKLALSLRVVRTDGSPAGFREFVLRNLLRAVDFLPVLFGIGVVTALLDRRLRRIGDLVAGTVVVSEARTKVLGAVAIEPPVSEEERRALPARVDLSREELRVLEAFLRRRRKLSGPRAEELAMLFAPALTQRTGVEARTAERILALAYARATGHDRDTP